MMTRALVHYAHRARQMGPGGTLQLAWRRTRRMSANVAQRCLYQWRVRRKEQLPWDVIDRHLAEAFLNPLLDDQERYAALFGYLVSGLIEHRAADLSHVYYRGASSTNGAAIDAMEGFCRIIPMIGAWIRSGRPAVIESPATQPVDLLEIVRQGVLAGTDRRAAGFWGDIGHGDQRIVEAADVALSLWLLRDHLWPILSSPEKDRIAAWLRSVNRKRIPNNNWHVFPMLVNEVLAALDCESDRSLSLEHYGALCSFYLGNGWFSDGPEGEVDYYNAWGIHYALFWINLVNPVFDPAFIDGALNQFVRSYQHLFSPDGFPICGRSICYRMAAPAPLVAAATRGLNGISPGMARKALDAVWQYFIKRQALRHGTITQGYWQQDLGLLDSYSGPGSSLWSTRSLTVAFYNAPELSFWNHPLVDLPVEQESFTVFIPEIQWEIRGIRSTREVQIVKPHNAGNAFQSADDRSRITRWAVDVMGLPYRAADRANRNQLQMYSSLRPFWMTPATPEPIDDADERAG
jgi:hypothetical protein